MSDQTDEEAAPPDPGPHGTAATGEGSADRPSGSSPAQRVPRAGGRLRGFAKDLVFVAIVLLAVRIYQQRDLPQGPAPALGGIDIHGQPRSLQDYRGQAVLVHFWATWCGVCKAEAGNISAIAQDLPVLTIASHSGTDRDVADYMRSEGLSWATLGDPRSELARRFGVRAYPTSFILNGEGEIRHVEVGYTTTLGLRARMWLAGL